MKKITYSDALMSDPEIKTGLHDEIVLWCFNNIKTIIHSLFKVTNYTLDKIEIEKPIMLNGVIVGFLDLYVRLEHIEHQHSEQFIIEVKSKITSLGELVRQVKYYKSHIYGNYIVVSPDIDKFADILKSQNIFSYKYEVK